MATKETKETNGPDVKEWAQAKQERDDALEAAVHEDGTIDTELVAEVQVAWEERKAELLDR